MKSNYIKLFVFIGLFVLFSSCVKKEIKGPEVPPNVANYYFPKSLVWRNLIQIIKNEYLIPFDYASYKRGYFTCQEVKTGDDPTVTKTKIRLSGSVTFDGSSNIVSIYKDIKVWDLEGGFWKTVPTDFVLETTILQRLAQKLKRYERKAKK